MKRLTVRVIARGLGVSMNKLGAEVDRWQRDLPSFPFSDNRHCMATIFGALIGLIAIVVAALLAARATRKTESRKQAGQLAADAFVDMMQSYAENSEARTVLQGSTADSLLQNASDDIDRAEFIKRLADSRVRAIAGKNRLMAFGSIHVAEAAHAALGSGHMDMADPNTQRALCELVQRIREDLYPGQDRIPDLSILEMLFGANAASLADVKSNP